MNKITDAIARLAGINVDIVKDEPDEVPNVDGHSDPDPRTQEAIQEPEAALDEIADLVDSLERGALHELDVLVDELEREVRDGI